MEVNKIKNLNNNFGPINNKAFGETMQNVNGADGSYLRMREK